MFLKTLRVAIIAFTTSLTYLPAFAASDNCAFENSTCPTRFNESSSSQENTASNPPAINTERTYWLSPGGLSFHTNREKKKNEVNYGIAAGYDMGDQTLGFGYYRNSHFKDSFFINYSWEPLQSETFPKLRAGMVVGAVTGYQSRYFDNVMPLVAPIVSYSTTHLKFNVLWIPKITGMTGQVFCLQLRIPLSTRP